jgi:hypothetical protein
MKHSDLHNIINSTKPKNLMEQTILNITEQLQKVITHLSDNEGVRGLVYSAGSLSVGLFSTILTINLIEIFQILSYGGSITVAVLTSYGMLRKYIKEYKKDKKARLSKEKELDSDKE